MGKCLNCGNAGLLLKRQTCLQCGRECCERCGFYVLTMQAYDKLACSPVCRKKYEDAVLNYSLGDLGTDFDRVFQSREDELWYKACMVALNKNDASWRNWMELVREYGTKYAMDVMNIQTTSPKLKCQNDLRRRFAINALLVLAGNMERAGRPLDAARIYEKNLKMYDKARALRERDKQVVVKSTNVSLNLNQLLQQVRDDGIVAVYRCPHCGGKLKISKDTNVENLKMCEHCGSEVETMDLADFLKTALS